MTQKDRDFSEHDLSFERDYYNSVNKLLNLTMKKQWDKVVEIYQKHPVSRKIKLTKSEETVLHISISSYSSRHNHFKQIMQMIDCIDHSEQYHVLSMQNVKGDTPLHLAAVVGWEAICQCIASKNRQLISLGNLLGETPLFIAAHHGKLQAFLCLHEIYKQEGEADESLCRRKDGNTILHSAISGEYFGIAYQIISYYPKLINFVNVDGESPLHVLARKPNVFKSSCQLGFYDSLIYHRLSVAELEQIYNQWATQNDYSSSGESDGETNYPGNSRTCANIFFCLSACLASCSWSKKRDDSQTDEEEIQHREENDGRFFPPNYTTCVSLFKSARKSIETVFPTGRIKRIQEMKQQHFRAFQIMSKMIDDESKYIYKFNGQCPTDLMSTFGTPETPEINSSLGIWKIEKIQEMKQQHFYAFQIMSDMIENESTYINKLDEQCLIDLMSSFRIPETPPEVNEYDVHHITDINSSSGEKAPSPRVLIFDTPLLVAAKTGTLEMVKEIINICPVATQDLDYNGKNMLMLVAENKQTLVFNYLLEIGLPDYMFYQVDKDGNNALHLAAMLDELQPCRLYGATLQMQWEIKWYEHVKRYVPPVFLVQQNAKGKTPEKTFTETHAKLVREGKEWIVKTSESCSVVAALIATVAFATSAAVPGGTNDQTGYPILQNHTAFDVFSISSLLALSLSITALVFFLSIISSRCEEQDFKIILPRKLFIGLTSLFASKAAMLVSFCAAHSFILRENLRAAAIPIYMITTIPMTVVAIAHMPFYLDLLWASST